MELLPWQLLQWINRALHGKNIVLDNGNNQMKKYPNKTGNSGILAYEAGADYITVKFSNERVCTYSYHKAGKRHVERMKDLAQSGRGLNTYINKYVKALFD